MHRDFSLASPRPLTRRPSLCIALASLLFRAQRFVHSLAVYFLLLAVFSRCLYLSFSVRSAALFRTPLLLGCPLSDRGRSRASAAADGCGIGVRQILLSGYEGVSRTQGHPCPFSLFSRLVARPLAFCFLSHSLTPLASFSSFLLAFAPHTPFRIPVISPFPFKPSFFFSRCSN